jgi:hypothetical protein
MHQRLWVAQRSVITALPPVIAPGQRLGGLRLLIMRSRAHHARCQSMADAKALDVLGTELYIELDATASSFFLIPYTSPEDGSERT